MIKKILFFTTLVYMFLPAAGQNAESADKNTGSQVNGNFGLFENESILDISLHFDLGTYLRKKPKDEYLKAVFTINPGKSDSISRKIKLRTRGQFRNSYCAYAPIELNLKNAHFGYTDLDSIGKMKLVTQCSSGAQFESYVLREYYAYKLYQVLTDTSFRVRLLRVTYYDSEKKKKPMTQYGIFIEPVEMLAERTGSVQVKNPKINQKHVIPVIMDRVAIFNYMIGNYDWSVPGQHNVRVLKTLKNPLGIAIPYDFDWSGLVNATYAEPAEIVGIRNVRQRLFLGVCRSRQTYNGDLDLFAAKKNDFLNVINNSALLKNSDKTDMADFLNGFFDQLKGNRESLLYFLTENCKNF